jgi:hypothetical protein
MSILQRGIIEYIQTILKDCELILIIWSIVLPIIFFGEFVYMKLKIGRDKEILYISLSIFMSVETTVSYKKMQI